MGGRTLVSPVFFFVALGGIRTWCLFWDQWLFFSVGGKASLPLHHVRAGCMATACCWEINELLCLMNGSLDALEGGCLVDDCLP